MINILNTNLIDFSDINNKYLTFDEAKLVIVELDIKTAGDYEKRYKENPLLPSNPRYIYRNDGWCGFVNFLSI